jgi:Ca-activated chloride channel homolog
MKKLLLLAGLVLLLGAAYLAPASHQNFILEGTVVDDSGQPLIGANILEKGTSNGTVTDLDGKFELQVPSECVQLEVSYTGYKTKTIPKACAGQELQIELEAETAALEEVVVTKRRDANKNQAISYLVSPQPNSRRTPAEPTPNWNTEDYGLIQENRFLSVGQEPLSTFSIDVDAASYSNVRRFVNNGQVPPKDAVRIEELVNYFEYDYAEPAGSHPFEANTELSTCPWQPEHQLLHIGLQGEKIPTEDLPPSNIVFLIDVSGSMSDANKLPLLKSSFKLLTNQLREQDRVAIAVYAGAAGLVLESTPGDNKQKILDALNQLKAGGSTAGGAGIQLAYQTAREHFIEGGNNRVILATDGDFNVGQSSDAALVRMIEEERESGVFLTVLGFGMGNYKENKMQQLANKGNGNHAYIDNINEARKVLVSEFGGTVFTIAKDVKIQIEFNPSYVQAYRLVGYENRLLENEDFNDDSKDAGELGSGHTVTALYEIIPPGVESDFIAEVDDLKYQKKVQPGKGSDAREIGTVKLRYKAPDGKKSQKLEIRIPAKAQKLRNSSDNFRWSAAVAEFGLLLRNSAYKGKASYAQLIELAEGAKGPDPHGYRQEFINMAKALQSLAEPGTAEKE